MRGLLEKIVEENKGLTKNGKVATYIPALGKVDPGQLGIAIVDMDENTYYAGDYNKKFTIQSISKPISLMLALMDRGEEEVFRRVGMEPTGDAFNSIVKLETVTPSKPLNPMINAGAIAVASLIKGRDSDEKFGRLLSLFKKISRNPYLDINQEVYISEKRTGDRNRSMAYFMRDVGIIEDDVEEVLDVYFRQCSIQVDCLDIANIGLFLANGGRIEKEAPIIAENTTRTVKSFMVTCGMYNASGEFAIKVGIPAKSGVGGGIMGAVPNKMGIGVFGPALDDKGNSIAGYGVLRSLSKELNLSIF